MFTSTTDTAAAYGGETEIYSWKMLMLLVAQLHPQLLAMRVMEMENSIPKRPLLPVKMLMLLAQLHPLRVAIKVMEMENSNLKKSLLPVKVKLIIAQGGQQTTIERVVTATFGSGSGPCSVLSPP